MAQTSSITKLVFNGSVFRLEFYVKLSGETLAEEWLEDLPENIQAKFAALFAWMGDKGRIPNEQKFKHLSGSEQIFEFKVSTGRILCFFFAGKRLILTHGFHKTSPKTPKREIDRATALKREFELRSRA